MSTNSNDYHISFFKPTTPQAKANRDMVVVFFCVWAVAIFGFQILLRVLEKPVPEDSLVTFNEVWPKVESGNATLGEFQAFTKSTMSVLGKVNINPDDKLVLDNAVSWSIMKICDSAQLSQLNKSLSDFEKIKSEVEDIADPTYIKVKNELSAFLSPLVGFNKNDIRAKILPLELNSSKMNKLEDENKEKLTDIMNLYLTHNRSVLTDFNFLGFPFHYFYTAVFLLILFVGICWLYCYRTDNLNKQFDNVE